MLLYFRLGELFLSRVSSLYKFREWAYNLTPEGWEQNRLLKLVHGFTESVSNINYSYQTFDIFNGISLIENCYLM